MADSVEDGVLPGSKRRRLRGSCDRCKQRKIRCDSAQMPGGQCTNCIAFNSECTHDLKPAGPKSQNSEPAKKASTQVNKAAAEISTVNKSAKAHVAAIVVQATTYIPESDVRRVLLDVARYARGLENQLSLRNQSPSLPSTTSADTSPSPGPVVKEEDVDFVLNGILTERFDRFSLATDASRYFGKSSHFELINTALGIQERCQELERPEEPLPSSKRPQYWFSQWEHEHLTTELSHNPLIFPEADLLQNLIHLFFTKVNIVVGLLHQPTFERSVATGLHLSDYLFGCTVLGVCALAAKYSDDPRVILPGTDNTHLSSGWAYFRQLPLLKKPLTRLCTLYEGQLICLAVIYLQGSSKPDACWALGGAGIRFAQEVGAHRRNRFADKIEAEHWKRVFWLLICIDTLSCSFSGRPRGTHSTDYDLDFPVDCDDEYWETDDPAMAFKQPPGKPSVASYSIAYYKLIEIMGMAQRTIYQENPKEKDEGWMREVIANIDSSLNDWIDQIPAHLRWDPHMPDPVFATQSAVLYACYYHVQIQVHRVFLNCPAIGGGPPVYPSLAICVSSARACSHVMDVASRRGFLCNPHILNAVFDSALVLLLNLWGGRYVGITVDPQKCLQDVEMCIRVFELYEPRWHIAGRQRDIINEFMGVANMNLSYSANPLKRRFELDSEPEPSTSDNSSPESQLSEVPDFSTTTSPSGLDPSSFALPMRTRDLGRLPVYEPLNWAQSWHKNLRPDEEILLPPDIQKIMTPTYDAALLPEANDLNATLLSGAPMGLGYDWDDWGKYILTVEELMQSFGNSNHG